MIRGRRPAREPPLGYHGDLTPANILLGHQGLKVVDFGLARYADLPHSTASRQLPLANPDYGPPEQIEHPLVEVKHPKAADIHMLGGTLLYTATGHPPRSLNFDTGDPLALLVGLGTADRFVDTSNSASTPDEAVGIEIVTIHEVFFLSLVGLVVNKAGLGISNTKKS